VNTIQAIGDFVWTGSSDGMVRVYDAKSQKLVHLCADHSAGVRCIAAVSDGSMVYTGGEDWVILQRDGRTGHALKQLGGHTSWIRSMAVYEYDPVGPVESSAAGTNGASDASANGHNASTASVAITPDGTIVKDATVVANVLGTSLHFDLWSASDDGIRVWNRLGECIAVLAEHGSSGSERNSDGAIDPTAGQSGISPSPSMSSNGIKHAGTIKAGAVKAPVSIHRSTVLSLCRVGHTIWSGGADKCICIWDARTKKLIKKIKAHANMVCYASLLSLSYHAYLEHARLIGFAPSELTHAMQVTSIKLVGEDVWSCSSPARQVLAWRIQDTDVSHTIQLPAG